MKKCYALLFALMVYLALPFQLSISVIAQDTFRSGNLTFSDDFSRDSGYWEYQGTAYLDSSNGYVVLTENKQRQGGILWFKRTFNCSFSAHFRYKAGGGTGADAISIFFYAKKEVFIEDSRILPLPGYGRGAGNAVEFDNYRNSYDPSSNHIALIEDSFTNHLLYANDPRTEDNRWHDVTINVGDSSVTVLVDSGVVLQWNGVLDKTYNYFGFSGHTGADTNWHIIDDFSLTLLQDHIIIDQASASDDRCEVGSTQRIEFHAKWDNGSDVDGGYVYINGTSFITNSSGWISFKDTLSRVGKKTLVITGVNCHGVTTFIQTAPNPSIIWDRVQITLDKPSILEKISSGKIFYDTFSKNSGTETDESWTIGTTKTAPTTHFGEGGKWTVENGMFRSEYVEGKGCLAYPTNLLVTDCIWEAKVKPMSLSGEGPEVNFNAFSKDGQVLCLTYDYYAPESSLRLMIKKTFYSPLSTYRVRSSPMQENSLYTMKVSVLGSTVKCYVDGVLVFNENDANVGSAPLREVWHTGYYRNEWGYWDDVKIWKSNTITISNLKSGQKIELYDCADRLKTSVIVGADKTQAMLDVSSLSFPFKGYFKVYATDGRTLLYPTPIYNDMWGGDEYTFNQDAIVQKDRIDVGTKATVSWHGVYEYDRSIFKGSITLNDTQLTYSTVGSHSYTVNSVIDPLFNLTAFQSNSVKIMWDRVKITLKIPNNRIEVGSTASINWVGVYEYDGATFSGSISYSDTLTKNVLGRYGYTVSSVTDPLYSLTNFTTNEVYCIFDRIKTETKVETLILGNARVDLGLKFEYEDSPVEDATVKINDVIAENIGNGIYRATLSSWMPYLTIKTEVKRAGFKPMTMETTNYLLGNIILGASSIMILGSVIALRLNARRVQRKKWDMNLKRLEELVREKGRVGMKEASESLDIDEARVKALLSELLTGERIRGSFTSDGKEFVTDERLKEEIRKGLE